MKKLKEMILRRLGILTLKKRSEEAEKTLNTLQKQVSELTVTCNLLKQQLNQTTQRHQTSEKLLAQVQALSDSLKQDNQALNQTIRTMNDFQSHVLERFGGLNQTPRDERLIVSLTSFPARIQYVSFVIERMLMQSFRADEIVLWLSSDQFENKEEDLPERLVRLKEYGLTIEWVQKDTRAYKKIIPALKRYPNDVIVILDDDLIYAFDHLEKLMEAHQKHPDAIIASRCHRMKLDEQNHLLPYKQWNRQCSEDAGQIREYWFFTGGAGTLFPANVYDERVLDEEKYLELAPLADDIWLNIHAAIRHVPIVNTAVNCYLRRIEGSQEVTLQRFNLARGENDVQLKKMTDFYSDLLKGTFYNKEA